jgi:hypothetical protein
MLYRLSILIRLYADSVFNNRYSRSTTSLKTIAIICFSLLLLMMISVDSTILSSSEIQTCDVKSSDGTVECSGKMIIQVMLESSSTSAATAASVVSTESIVIDSVVIPDSSGSGSGNSYALKHPVR